MSPVACGGSAEVMSVQSFRSSPGSPPGEASPPEMAPDLFGPSPGRHPDEESRDRAKGIGSEGQSPGPGAYRRGWRRGQAGDSLQASEYPLVLAA